MGYSMFSFHKDRTDLARFNPIIVDGIAYHELSNVPSDVEAQIRQISHSFIDGFEFTGCQFATGTKEIERSVIRGAPGRGNRLKLDKNTTYMLELGFRYNGQDLNSGFVRVPYVRRAGETILNGKVNRIHAVMVDRGVNLKGDSMYVYLNRANYTYTRTAHSIRRNNIEIRDNVLTARLHQQSDKDRLKCVTKTDKRLHAEPSIFLYLVMTMGLTDAVKHYFGEQVKVVTGEYEEVAEKYPFPKHTIYSSVDSRPSGLKKPRWRSTRHIHLLFEGRDSALHQVLAANFFYLLDHFPMMLDETVLDDTETWKAVGGHFIFNTDETTAKLVDRINDHLQRSVGTLMDRVTQNELKMDGIEVSSIYELIAWLIVNEKVTFKEKTVSSMNDKRLTVSRYTLSYLSKAITNLSYAMGLLKGQNNITVKKLNELIRKHLREGLIRSLTKEHGEVRTVQSSTDSAWNITRVIVPQGQTKNRTKAQGNLMYKPENKADSSMLMHTQLPGMPKSQPNGREYINPYLRLGPGGRLNYDVRYQPAVDLLKRRIGR